MLRGPVFYNSLDPLLKELATFESPQDLGKRLRSIYDLLDGSFHSQSACFATTASSLDNQMALAKPWSSRSHQDIGKNLTLLSKA